MYKIVNYDRFWSHEKTFDSFDDAFMMQQLVDDKAIIEHWTDDSMEVVWNPEWSEKVLNRFGGRGFEVVVKECRKNNDPLPLPERMTESSAGYDFHIYEDVEIEPFGTYKYFTDVKAYMESDEFLMLIPRSSIGIKKGLMLSNTCGIVDSDFYCSPNANDGNIGLFFRNITNKTVTLSKGERIAQGIFIKYLTAENCNLSNVRSGGFGSTN